MNLLGQEEIEEDKKNTVSAVDWPVLDCCLALRDSLLKS